MNSIVQTPFKLTLEESLCSAAATICLSYLTKAGTSITSVDEMSFTPQYGFTASATLEPCGPRFVRITDIKGGTIDWQAVPFCLCSDPNTYKLASDDILVARSGSVGKSFIITNVSETAIFASYMIRFRTKENTIPPYLYWCFQSQQFWQQVMAANRGSAMKNINAKMLTNLRFPCPPQDIQKAIVLFLESFRERLKGKHRALVELPLPLQEVKAIIVRIEELTTRIEEARGSRQDIVDETELLIKATKRHVFQSIRNFQDTYLENVCSEIIDNLHSNPVYAEDGIPCVRSPDVGWGKLFLDKARKTNEEEYTRRTVRGEPKMDDIVLVREGGGIGKAAIVEDGQRFSLGQRVMMLRPNKNIVIPKFFLYQILSPLIYDEQILTCWKGSASPHLNISTLRRFKLRIPPITEQRRIVAYLENLQAKVDALKQLQAETQAELDALLLSILDKAFKGELV